MSEFPPEPIHSLFYDVVIIDALADDIVSMHEYEKERIFREAERLIIDARMKGQITSREEEELRQLLNACKVFIESDIPEEEYKDMREFGKDPCSILYTTVRNKFIDKSTEIWRKIKENLP